MAEHYTHVSFVAVLPRDVAHDIMQGIELLQEYGQAEYGDIDSIPQDVKDALGNTCSIRLFSALMQVLPVNEATCTNCTAKVEDIGADDGTERLVVYSADGSANVDGIADIISAVLTTHEVDDIVAFEWANTCSKPRTGEFAGGYVVISRHDMLWGNTGQLMAEAVREMEYRHLEAKGLTAGLPLRFVARHALAGLLGDTADIIPATSPVTPGATHICRHCGREYMHDDVPKDASECSDDCPAYAARKLLNELDRQRNKIATFGERYGMSIGPKVTQEEIDHE